MNRSDLLNQVQDIFRDILGKHDLVLEPAMTSTELKEWDSFAQIVIVDAMEKHFRVKFGLGEIDQLTSVDHILTALESKLNAKTARR